MENLRLGAETRTVIDRIDHAHIGVADINRSIEFYRNVFGFEVRYDGGEPIGRCVHIGTDNFYIAMTEKPGIARSVANDAPLTAVIYHLGFATRDLDGFKERLKRLGIQIDDTYYRKEGESIYISDPDGHEIEVVAYRTDYVYRG